MSRFPLWIAAALALALWSGQAGAQQESSESSQDTTVTFLKETVVTGARYPRAYYRSPQALSFVTRRRMIELAPIVSGDLLSTLPGVDTSKDSPWEQRPNIRGLGGQRVMVLVDGSPMNSARGNGPHPSLVDASQVQRIEVVRGPSSVAYGSDALGGVINIITRDGFRPGGQTFAGTATLGASSGDNQRNFAIDVSPRFGKLSTMLSVGGRKADDFRSPERTVPNSGFEDYNGLLSLRYDFTSRLALKGGYQMYRGSNIGIPGLSVDVPGFRQVFDFKHYDRDFAHLTLEHKYPSSWLETTWLKGYWQRESRNFYSTQDISFFGAGPPGVDRMRDLKDRFFDLDTYGFQAQFATPQTDLHRFSAGFDAVRDKTSGDNISNVTFFDAGGNAVGTSQTVSASLPKGRFDSYGVYMQSEWFVHRQWTLSAGGRFTQYRYRTDGGLNMPAGRTSPATFFEPMKRDDGAFSGSIGAVYEPVKDLHVTANIASGYRQPNAQDLFFNGPASVGTVLGNTELDPERSLSYDAGVRWGPGNLAFSGNVYYSTYDDLIDAVAVAPAVFQYINIAKARIWGAEMEGEWRFLPQWNVSTSMAGAVGDITDRNAIMTLFGVDSDMAPLPNVPPFKGQLAVRWHNADNRYWVEPRTRFSWRTNRLPLPTPGVPQFTEFKKEWIVADLFAGMRLPSGQQFVVGVRNLTDHHYTRALASLEDPGISFVASVSSDF